MKTEEGTKEHQSTQPHISSMRRFHKKEKIDWLGYFTLTLLIVITLFCAPIEGPVDTVSVHIVWYYGWITAICTGLGVIPFIFVKKPDNYWMGISNALAAGMMMAASYSLMYEGFDANVPGKFLCIYLPSILSSTRILWISFWISDFKWNGSWCDICDTYQVNSRSIRRNKNWIC
jgi:hypothetical protein